MGVVWVWFRIGKGVVSRCGLCPGSQFETTNQVTGFNEAIVDVVW